MSTLKQNVLAMKRCRGTIIKNIKTPFLSLNTQANQQSSQGKILPSTYETSGPQEQQKTACFRPFLELSPVHPASALTDSDTEAKTCLHAAQLHIHKPWNLRLSKFQVFSGLK